ncbi:MAG: hypothetical protein GY851_00070 [bacterium]|nr:hypothetical protein [bacterium]
MSDQRAYGRVDRNDPMGHSSGSEGAPGQGTAGWLRMIATVIGLGLIVMGALSVIRITGAAFNVLSDPQGIEQLVAQWYDIIGGDELVVEYPDGGFSPGRFLAVAVLGGGTFLLAILCMTLMTTGARIISITTGEKEAMKRLAVELLAKAKAQQGILPKSSE